MVWVVPNSFRGGDVHFWEHLDGFGASILPILGRRDFFLIVDGDGLNFLTGVWYLRSTPHWVSLGSLLEVLLGKG